MRGGTVSRSVQFRSLSILTNKHSYGVQKMKDEQPKVSIIILSFNQEQYLEQAILSAVNQTYKNIEIIISDNGSTDSSKSIARNYRDKDHRVIFLDHQENLSISLRQNQALQESSGMFISTLYGDDLYMPNKIEAQINSFSSLSGEWGVVHGPGSQLDELTGKTTHLPATAAHGSCLKKLFLDYTDGFLVPISPLVRRSVLLEFPLYEDMFSEGESVYWRIATKYKFFYSDTPLVVMRYHSKNMGKTIRRNMDMHLTCLDRLQDSTYFTNDFIPHLNYYKSHIIFSNAWHCLRVNFEVNWAKKLIINFIKVYPRALLNNKYQIALIFCLLPARALVPLNKMLNHLFNKKHFSPLKEYYD